MPQVFGADQISLIAESSLWVEAASERDIERATHPDVAAEARARGLVPLRVGGNGDPIWHHPATGKMFNLTAAHAGDGFAQSRAIANNIAKIKRAFPTAEESAKAARTPEQIQTEQNAVAQETKSKKQQAVDAAKRRKEQDALTLFRKLHHPFKSQDEIQQAFDKRSPNARMVRPDDTVDQFTGRLRDLAPADRQRVHQSVFPERYR